MYAVFATTIFVGAFLLFSVQPLVARQLLPAVGGAASVWNACMLFFQAALLCGYAYAHGITRLRSTRAQIGLHLILVFFACASLPLHLPDAPESAVARPVMWLLRTLAVSIGPPFVVLAATSPLLQSWFSQSTHRRAHDPYFLYAAGNLGSLIALLGYPVLIEPLVPLSQQHIAWAIGYGVLALALVATAVVRRGMNTPISRGPAPRTGRAEGAEKESWVTIARWLALSFVPSSLTLGVTAHMTADLGSAPLLWTVPLGLYLITFILAFSNRPGVRSERFLPALSGPALFVAATAGQALETVPIGLAVALHLGAFFVAALTCHARLAELRPGTHRLTAFYLWIAVGGVLGGFFNTIIAPALFSWPLEYPLVLALACLLRLRPLPATRSMRLRQLLWASGFAVAALVCVLAARALIATGGLDRAYAWFNVPLLLLALLALRRPLAFAVLIAILPMAAAQLESAARRQHVSRDFFGVHRVFATADRAVYRNGTTVHGMQNLRSRDRCTPLAYYHPRSPVARAIEALRLQKPIGNAALVGLGVGSLAPYAGPGEHWQFLEIDHEVERIAKDGGFFTFMSDCVAPGARVSVRIVDGRLALARAASGSFDLVVVDAFSSDVIPVHLVTREALALYRNRLSRGGLLLFHISNRHYDLRGLLARLGSSVGMDVLIGHDQPTEDEEENQGRLQSTWIAMMSAAAAPQDPGPRQGLLDRAGFHVLDAPAAGPFWTDQQASLLSVIRFDAFWGK